MTTRLTPAQIRALTDIRDHGYTYAAWGTQSRLITAGMLDKEAGLNGKYVITPAGAEALRAATGPKQVGRPAKYASNAEKQAAYRERHQGEKPLTLSEARSLILSLHTTILFAAGENDFAERCKGNNARETIKATAEQFRRMYLANRPDSVLSRLNNL